MSWSQETACISLPVSPHTVLKVIYTGVGLDLGPLLFLPPKLVGVAWQQDHTHQMCMTLADTLGKRD